MDAFIHSLTTFVQNPDVQRALVLIGLKSALILLLAGGVAFALREASAARRHLIWTMALAGVLLLPVLEMALPAWRVALMEADAPVFVSVPPVPPAPPVPEAIDMTGHGFELGDIEFAEPAPVVVLDGPLAYEMAAQSTRSPLVWLAALWVVGLMSVGLYYLVGLMRLNGWTGKAEPVEDGRVRALARDVMWELDVAREVALRWTDDAVTPLTFGVLKPVVLLPRASQDWDDERLRVVLLHEFAHIRRLDALTQTVAQVACALFWFNPLVWWGAHRLRVERERACDDYVLARGTRASAYAAHLLDIARSLRSRAPIGAVSMAHRGELEGRLLAILEPAQRREILNRAMTVAAGVLFAAVLLPLAAFKPWDVQAQSLTTVYHAPLPALAPEAPFAPEIEFADEVGMDELFDEAMADVHRAQGGDETIRRTFSVQPGGRIEVNTDVGSITVETGRSNEVEVEVEHNLDDFEVRFDQSGNTVRVRGDRERQRNWGRNQKARFVIRVPSRFNAKLETSGGSISVGDLEGTVDVNTSGGSLTFGRIKGKVRGHTAGGSIQLAGTTGDVEVETSGGSIRLGDVGGTVRAETSGGSITIEEVGGDVIAETSGGSVSATITRQPRGQCKLETSGGSIRVNLASGLDLDLDAETSGGRVVSDFHPEHRRDRRGWGSDRLQAKIGRGGPPLRLRTSAGSIHINRVDGRSSQARPAPATAPGFAYSYSYTSQMQRDMERTQREVQRELEQAQRETQRELEQAQRDAERAQNVAQRNAERRLEQQAAEMGVNIAEIVNMALDEAFQALEHIDWEETMSSALSDLSDEELAELQQSLEEARADLRDAQRDMAEVHLNKREAQREVEKALRESEAALQRAQRERELRRRNGKGPK